VVVVVFAVIAGASVAVPVIGYLVAAKAMAGPLDSMRIWLVRPERCGHDRPAARDRRDADRQGDRRYVIGDPAIGSCNLSGRR
jgi:hypothetical protein